MLYFYTNTLPFFLHIINHNPAIKFNNKIIAFYGMFKSNRQMRRMLDRMGLNMNELNNVQEVIIRTADKEIIIKEPVVAELKAQDSTIYQVIASDVEERAVERKSFSDEDIMLVMQQTGVSREIAIKALEDADGDIAKAILSLT